MMIQNRGTLCNLVDQVAEGKNTLFNAVTNVYKSHLSLRSLRSSIRSGASNVVSGIVNLTRVGSMRLRNSIRRQGSIRRQDEVNEARTGGTPVARPSSRGRAGSTSEQQLLDQQSNGSDHLLDSAESSQSSNGVRAALTHIVSLYC